MKKQNINTFETELTRLQEISALLDNDELDLETAMKLYEEGVELSRSCIKTLKEAELKVTEIKKKLETLKTEEEEFLE
ncbi:MAG: exodeoxyribonuclease VII small subunit [Ignavibacteriaceae bacterium]|jgi:exodeoxyribonuclease VII small subunit|nr:exodeoxyribonuclease VII small subunit [Ignavibacteriaceae bacterium]